MPAKRSSTRIRPMSCDRCGYHVYGTRSWWGNGFPQCACGGTILPTKGADLAWCGLISQDDVPGPVWTAICRENGWDDVIVRKGAAFKAWERNPLSRLDNRRGGAAHCAHPGCGRWVAAGADVCTAGHPQCEDATVETAAAMPF